jgi:hypothetical protein
LRTLLKPDALKVSTGAPGPPDAIPEGALAGHSTILHIKDVDEAGKAAAGAAVLFILASALEVPLLLHQSGPTQPIAEALPFMAAGLGGLILVVAVGVRWNSRRRYVRGGGVHGDLVGFDEPVELRYRESPPAWGWRAWPSWPGSG